MAKKRPSPKKKFKSSSRNDAERIKETDEKSRDLKNDSLLPPLLKDITLKSQDGTLELKMNGTRQCLDRNHVVASANTTFQSELDKQTEDILIADFSIVLGDLDHWYGYMWSVTLGTIGVLDILASSEPYLRDMYGSCFDNDTIEMSVVDESSASSSLFCSSWIPLMIWLHNNNVSISFLFSLLWFKLQFNKANFARHYAMIQEDKSCLLADENDEKDKKSKTNQRNPQVIYYLRVLTGMLFLPIGFYVIVYDYIHDLWNGKGLIGSLNDPLDEPIVFSVKGQDEDEGGVIYEVFTEQSKICLAFAVLKHIQLCFLAATVMARIRFTEYLKKSIPHLIRRSIGSFIRSPRKSLQSIKTTLKYIRWGRFTIPMIGTLNKLKGNLQDLLKKWRSHAVAEKQKRIRKILWKKKSEPVRKQDAAILIQSAWRSYITRRYTHAMVLLLQDQKAIAAQKIQAVLRRKLAEARHRILKKRIELLKLEKQSIYGPEKLKPEERRRLYKLQDEFTEEAKKTINRRLLMRPNTKFAVIWKILFVFCIGVEIGQKAAIPLLRMHHLKIAIYRLQHTTFREFLAETFVPKRVSEHPDCQTVSKQSWMNKLSRRGVIQDDVVPQNTTAWFCHEPYSTWRDNYRDVVALVMKPYPVADWPECQDWKPKTMMGRLTVLFHKKKKPKAWYCSKPYSTIQLWYVRFIDLLVDEFMSIVSIVCFLDVFVTFFTGEIDPKTGELVPKPLFERWIIPGLLLQLLVNPAIESLSEFVFAVGKRVMDIGPVRVLRWCIAVLVPIIYGIMKIILKELNTIESEKAIVDYELTQRRRSLVVNYKR